MEDARRALDHWDVPGELRPVDSGLINQTWAVVDGARTTGILQRLNTAIFRAVVHEDIEAVTARLAERGMPTPRLVRTRAGGLWHEDSTGVWRILTPVGDRTVAKLASPEEAREAGRLVARFHAETRDLAWDFRMVRAGAHDTDRHLTRLKEGVARHSDHRLHRDVAALTVELEAAWRAWGAIPALPTRIIHGDLKISNLRFLGPRAHALVDLDTLARGTLDIELGDALRSWCNTGSEDTLEPMFDAHIFGAAMAGYREAAADVTDAEWAAIVPGTERIATELAMRFALDALDESYFGWKEGFGGRGEHNLLRARGQAALARSIREQRSALTP